MVLLQYSFSEAFRQLLLHLSKRTEWGIKGSSGHLGNAPLLFTQNLHIIMKHYSRYPLLVLLGVIFSLSALAQNVTIDGIDYVLDTNKKAASVAERVEEYYGDIAIPSSVVSNGTEYAVTGIGEGAFRNCLELKSISLPNSLTSIANWAFLSCSSLTSITIPASVTSIGKAAFGGCTALTSMSVATGNAHYDSRDNCNAIILTDENTLIAGCRTSTLPATLKGIGYGAFLNQSGLTSIDFPESLTNIGEAAFEGCHGLTSITLPNSVISIGESAFNLCTGLTSATLSKSLTQITDFTFFSCEDLVSIEIPEGVASVGWGAFGYCASLTSVVLPASLKKLGDSAFFGCPMLTSVACGAVNPPTCESGVFTSAPLTYAILRVPASSVETYRATSPWSSFGEIIGMDTGIEQVEANAANGTVYNLKGQRVAHPDKGFFIIGGKKVIR